jgi:pSer/pThr/pTyr-binding forkhead associated (FHA) protein
LADHGIVSDTFTGPNGTPMHAQLIFRRGKFAGKPLLFHQQPTIIGRTEECDLIILSPVVSKQQARMWCQEGMWMLEDLQSANGTIVNGTRIYSPVLLRDGDIIQFGGEQAIFHVV